MNVSKFLRRILGWRADSINPRTLDRMRSDWDERAKKNARHYVATLQEHWTDEEFFASGATWVRYYIESSWEQICAGRDPLEMRVLEVGCGAGRMTLPLSRLFGRIDAVDVSPEMVARAREAVKDQGNVHLHVNNGSDLSMFSDEQFDFVFSAIVFQHIPSRAIVENYIREAWRVLRPHSLFKFQVQGGPSEDRRADTWVGVSFSDRQIRDIAEKCRFRIQETAGAGTQEFWLTFLKE